MFIDLAGLAQVRGERLFFLWETFSRRLALPGLALLFSVTAVAQGGATTGEWRFYGGGNGGAKYSSLDIITAENVGDLEIAWRWTSIDAAIQKERADGPRVAGATYFQCTPLMIGGVLYGSTSLGQAMAIDGKTGETIWQFDPKSYKAGRPPNLGFISRGVAYWEADEDKRIYLGTGDSYLIALDARTGKPIASFGDNGRADLTAGVPRARHGQGYGHPSPPLIVGDIVMMASSVSDGTTVKEGIPGRIKAFDVRTGTPAWTFNIVPEEGEFGTDTWEDAAWSYSGGANVWSIMTADDETGYVYLPTSTPTNDYYGGHRLGNNLFAESVVCLNAATGERVWHFQTVHHGLWDYDNPAPPNLVDITVDGKRIKAVAQVTKQGFTFVLDRITGKPVWPIEERAVAQSDVPGERTSPTQPFPTKPPPFTGQGVSIEDLIDLTPELRLEALEIVKDYNIGPLYTPPMLDKPTIFRPGTGGGANWPGAAFDPETGILYVPSMNQPSVMIVTKPDPARSNFRYTRGRARVHGPRGLPLMKPPYGRITAIDLNKGEHVWEVVNGGDGPRDHPALKGLDLPPLGTNTRAGALVTKTVLFVTEGSGRTGSATGGGNKLRAFDKATGAVLAEFVLPDHATGVPMTYMVEGKQYVVVAIGSSPAQFVAFSLPS